MLSSLVNLKIKSALEEELEINRRIVALLKHYLKEINSSKRQKIIDNEKGTRCFENIKEILLRNKSLSYALLLSLEKYIRKLGLLEENLTKKIRLLKVELYVLKSLLLKIEELKLAESTKSDSSRIIESIVDDVILELDSCEELRSRITHFLEELKGSYIHKPIVELVESFEKQRKYLKMSEKSLIETLMEDEIEPNARLVIGVSKLEQHRKHGLRFIKEFNKRILILDKKLIKLSELERKAYAKDLIAQLFFNTFEELLKGLKSSSSMKKDFIGVIEKRAEKLLKSVDKNLRKISPV